MKRILNIFGLIINSLLLLFYIIIVINLDSGALRIGGGIAGPISATVYVPLSVLIASALVLLLYEFTFISNIRKSKAKQDRQTNIIAS